MRKSNIILSSMMFVVLAFLIGCNNTEQVNRTTEPYLVTTNIEVTTMSGDFNLAEPILWVEDDNLMPLDESGLRTIGIRYREVDLTQPYLAGGTWDDIGLTIELQGNSSQVLYHEMVVTRDDAVRLAQIVLTNEQRIGRFIGFELMQVDNDTEQNIWIFSYWINNIEIDGNSIHVAMCGMTGELLRAWVL